MESQTATLRMEGRERRSERQLREQNNGDNDKERVKMSSTQREVFTMQSSAVLLTSELQKQFLNPCGPFSPLA